MEQNECATYYTSGMQPDQECYVCVRNCALSQRAKEIEDHGTQNGNNDAKQGAGNWTYAGNCNEDREEEPNAED